MKLISTNELSCSVFGHNFHRSKPLSQTKAELTCNRCNAKEITDSNGDFKEFPYSNPEIYKALRQLFILQRNTSTSSYSI